MASLINRHRRFLLTLPMLSAIVYQGIALERWVIACLALVCSIVMLYSSMRIQRGVRFVTAIILISLAGLAVPSGMSPVIGVLPPIVGDFLLNLFIAFGICAAVNNRFQMSHLFAWILIGLSIHQTESPYIYFPMLCFLVSLLMYAAVESGLFKASRNAHFIFVLCLVAAGFLAIQFGNLTRAAQVMIQDALGDYYDTFSGSSITGISDELFIGARGSLVPSKTPILELSMPVTRLRTRVFDQFDGSRWFASRETREAVATLEEDAVSEAAMGQLEMMWLGEPNASIPTPPGTLQVQGEEVRIEGGWVFRGKGVSRELRAIFNVREQLHHEKTNVSRLTKVPDSLESFLSEFTNDLVADQKDTIVIAKTVEAYFRDNYQYSLNTRFDSDRHPMIQMLEEGQNAYCVYFASAMALMLRSQGLPARVVSGYLPVEENTLTKKVTVRKRDAHAWVEVWMATENRFVPFDPTPLASRNQMLGITQDSNLAADLLNGIVSLMRRLWSQSNGDPILFLLGVIRSTVGKSLLAVLIGILIWRGLYRYQRRQRKQRTGDLVDQDLLAAYDAYCNGLRQKGITLQPNEIESVAVEKLRANGFCESASLAEDFLNRYQEMRFGTTPYSGVLMGIAQRVGD